MKWITRRTPVVQDLCHFALPQNRRQRIIKCLNDAKPCQSSGQMRVAFINANAMRTGDLNFLSLTFEPKRKWLAGLRREITHQPVSVAQFIRIGEHTKLNAAELFVDVGMAQA